MPLSTERFSGFLVATSNRWVRRFSIGTALILGFLMMWGPVPFSNAHIEGISGGQSVLEFTLGYSSQEGAAALAALGAEGIRHYGYFQVADIFFPASYAVAFCSIAVGMYRRRCAIAFAGVFLLTAVSDYVENAAVFLARSAYPQPAPTALAVASAAGTTKFIGFGLSASIVLLGTLVHLSRCVRS